MRLCANSGCQLHLIHPLGFEIDDKRMRRAGLDYIDKSLVKEYPDYASCLEQFSTERTFACSTKGSTHYTEINYQAGDVFVFGPETRGLPDKVRAAFPQGHILRVPMLENSRSINLSNTVGIFIYEAWRQIEFYRCCVRRTNLVRLVFQ